GNQSYQTYVTESPIINMAQDMSIEWMIRRLRHRLKGLGMTELDVWLAPLDEALLLRDPEIIKAIEELLQLESPQLLQMMGSKDDMPSLLKQWLY
ncbi:MAG: hypothetical protein Q9M15_05035, partial [Mariprofundaceae bacterium]|nr:hypothetical protein [Mariprofundaceae bacterium]